MNKHVCYYQANKKTQFKVVATETQMAPKSIKYTYHRHKEMKEMISSGVALNQ